MIGSFWNLCRACPSMPVDKLHSEYRSTYRWHEYTGGPEVVRKPPVPNQFASSKADFFSKSTEDDKFIEASINEPPLPRRKKCPELAYRSHEFMSSRGQEHAGGTGGAQDRPDAATTHSRARSEERGTPSRRSKSEGPPGVANGRLPTGTGIANGTHEPVSVEGGGRVQQQAGESSGLFKKTIYKLSTEYRLQFVWPHVRRAIKGAAPDGEDSAAPHEPPPRKSLSMGAIKAAQAAATSSHVPTVHKKRTTNEREANAHELEPLVNDVEAERPQHEKRDMATVVEHKLKAYRSDKEKFGFEPELDGGGDGRAHAGSDSTWYKEVIELRKKAGEYKSRGWGVEMNPELFNKQQELWEQVSRRSSLSALSLASSVRPITKEEKEKENNKKSSPTKPHAGGRGKFPGSARPVDMGRTLPDGLAFSRSRKDNVRHHLERTTGVDMEEGALLPSPTREKLMPAIPRSKGDSPQRGSPQKTGLSRHGSPQKGSPQKSSPKKTSNKDLSILGRSQSVGPAVASDGSTVGTVGGGSPKRQIRSGSTATASTASSAAKAHNKKTPTTTATTPSSQPERRPRPTEEDAEKDNCISVSSASPLPAPEINEQIIKSPPEPTRVKSPEQIIMRSPDPVNWTVPLDTGKTFTVTQNVREGECPPGEDGSQILPVAAAGDPMMRPHSEIKASTPVEPPPAPQSAPPELAEQSKMPSSKLEPDSIKESEDEEDEDLLKSKSSVTSSANPVSVAIPVTSAVGPASTTAASAAPSAAETTTTKAPATAEPAQSTPAPEVPRFDKPVPGSTLRCLDDPTFDTADINSPVTNRNVASDVLDKARDRFDRFWGNPDGSKPDEP
ncbi:nascent polypeptide-associated complex subunit alpha, muscle-specific form-like isoform X7 [Culex pipiens pallens]|uniref:nascent polypeptide-associated complex subunit alpha, muscle-specific form-like isoform X7 n=1 Tax=Culex pipiens pallens TaxID=42434 RepID=UPI001953A09C|nr:nascent polypeptide-associated complex subunit alpha, muscle-specific form-like isoform X7 [Culex pipiens pallens]